MRYMLRLSGELISLPQVAIYFERCGDGSNAEERSLMAGISDGPQWARSPRYRRPASADFQFSSATILIAPQGHSVAHMPQPLQ